MSGLSYICAGLYVSDWRTAVEIDYEEEECPIGQVITVMSADELDYYCIEAEDFAGAKWTCILLEDDEEAPIADHFEPVCRLLGAAHGKATLIHCMAGVSRSPTLAAAWLMKHYGFAADDALNLLMTRRPQVAPNPGFRVALSALSTSASTTNVDGGAT
jgi:protein-tyrosine phosphatase